MTVIVRVPTTLRPATGGASEVRVEGKTLGEVLDGVEAAHPAFAIASSTPTETCGGS